MLNSKTVQLCALLESLIDQHGHNTSRLIQGLIKKLPEYFMGDKAQENGNQILLKKMDDNWEDIEVGILEIYDKDIKNSFPASKVKDLKQYKNENFLEFAFLIAFNTNNHILIKEVDDNRTDSLDFGYNT